MIQVRIIKTGEVRSLPPVIAKALIAAGAAVEFETTRPRETACMRPK
jgi:hypothetical protein